MLEKEITKTLPTIPTPLSAILYVHIKRYDNNNRCGHATLTYPLKRQLRLQQTTFLNFFHCFSEKIRLDVSSESSAWQRIHMKNQALFFFER